MTDLSIQKPGAPQRSAANARLRRRYAAERRFRFYGLAAIGLAATILVVLLGTIVYRGVPAFFQTFVQLEVYFDPEVIAPTGEVNRQTLAIADFQSLAKKALYEHFPDVTERRDRRALTQLLSQGADWELRERVWEDPSLIGTTQTVWLKTSADVDTFMKGVVTAEVDEADRRLKDNQIAWLQALQAEGWIETRFDTEFFTTASRRWPAFGALSSAHSLPSW